MNQEENFEWIDFYSELADKIAPYRSRRSELIKIIEAAYAQMGMRLPKLDNGEPTDIDPFTVFGLFNKGIKDENRTKIAIQLATALGMSSRRRPSSRASPSSTTSQRRSTASKGNAARPTSTTSGRHSTRRSRTRTPRETPNAAGLRPHTMRRQRRRA